MLALAGRPVAVGRGIQEQLLVAGGVAGGDGEPGERSLAAQAQQREVNRKGVVAALRADELGQGSALGDDLQFVYGESGRLAADVEEESAQQDRVRVPPAARRQRLGDAAQVGKGELLPAVALHRRRHVPDRLDLRGRQVEVHLGLNLPAGAVDLSAEGVFHALAQLERLEGSDVPVGVAGAAVGPAGGDAGAAFSGRRRRIGGHALRLELGGFVAGPERQNRRFIARLGEDHAGACGGVGSGSCGHKPDEDAKKPSEMLKQA